MCGIVGSFRFSPLDQASLIAGMNLCLKHRGPDAEGVFESTEQGAAMGMTRLSIIGIARGHQPMFDEHGRYALVYNGEVYSYRDLWTELVRRGHEFRSDHSDTDVVVHGFEEWGTGVFARLNGM